MNDMETKSVPSVLLTIDVEDWFQVENFKSWIPFSTWDSKELRVEKNIHRLLDLFDERGENRDPISATFFILGWIAERAPHLIREIGARGHEIASHGLNHALNNSVSPRELRAELRDSKKLLEDLVGAPVHGYRAPSFAIDDGILRIIGECGYRYESSYNSFGMHGRYGRITLDSNGAGNAVHRISDGLFELPVSNLSIGKRILPWAGGGYFRLFPFPVFIRGVKRILEKDGFYNFYMHPWEFDPDQPRVQGVSPGYRFRHYINLKSSRNKLSALIKNLAHCRFSTCRDYLEQLQRAS